MPTPAPFRHLYPVKVLPEVGAEVILAQAMEGGRLPLGKRGKVTRHRGFGVVQVQWDDGTEGPVNGYQLRVVEVGG